MLTKLESLAVCPHVKEFKNSSEITKNGIAFRGDFLK
jgi:hypothetical protein